MISSYILEAICSDNGLPKALTSSVLVNIEISDANDNPPLFDKTNYTVHVQEGRPVGYSLISFNIHDADSAANSGPFTLNIISGNLNDSFIVNNEDISLRTNAVFNHSLQTNYSIVVRASDSGTPSLNSSATVVCPDAVPVRALRAVAQSSSPPVLQSSDRPHPIKTQARGASSSWQPLYLRSFSLTAFIMDGTARRDNVEVCLIATKLIAIFVRTWSLTL